MTIRTLFDWSLSAMLWPENEQQPGLMSEERISEWFDAMNDERLPLHSMDAETAEGYLTATYLSPDAPPFANTLAAIFGQDELPLCNDPAFEERLLKLTHHRWHDIQERLRQPFPSSEEAERLFLPSWGEIDPNEVFKPYKLDSQGQRVGEWMGKAWARGFLEHVRDEPTWDYLLSDTENYHSFAPLVLLDQGYNPDKPELQIEDRQDLMLFLAQCLYEMRSYWRANAQAALDFVQDLESEAEQPFYRESRKIGRNEPCPCGSGKKYKKCCGA
jgi:uncharacterized protein